MKRPANHNEAVVTGQQTYYLKRAKSEHAKTLEAKLARDTYIVGAFQEGATLNMIARTVGMTRMSIRYIIRRDTGE